MTTIDRDTRPWPSWRAEMRQDRLASAQIEPDREAARVPARIAERRALRQLRRENELAGVAALAVPAARAVAGFRSRPWPRRVPAGAA